MASVLNELTRARTAAASNVDVGAVVVGISGAHRNPAAAVAVGGRLRGFCEQERLTRIRGTGLRPGELPHEAVQAVLALVDRQPDGVSAFVTAEDGVSIPAGLPRCRLDHHQGHAAAAFLTSSSPSAAVLVCDQHSSPEVSVWLAGDAIVNQQWPWSGEGFASLYTQCSQVFGFGPGQEHRLEALARLNRGLDVEKVGRLFQYVDGGLRVHPDWKRVLADWLYADGPRWSVEHGARVAGAFQRVLGGLLVELVADIQRRLGATHLCLGGGLFYNTFFNTAVAECGSFEEVFVPPNPGNPGIAAGAALAVGRLSTGYSGRDVVSEFLGPEFSLEDVKRTVDNCKLSYECLSEGEVVAHCVQDLLAGRLVGWFQGGMEWGHRALGNRSILANPLSPYVLDNLNVFLKQRERHRAYGLSVCEEELERYFDGPRRSPWMQYEYRMKDAERFRHVLPFGSSTLRVQTVQPAAALFRQVHAAFAAATGTGVLVNTSFNGFSEPIVCSPRDAIRVFYGTGLDVLVMGRFIIRK